MMRGKENTEPNLYAWDGNPFSSGQTQLEFPLRLSLNEVRGAFGDLCGPYPPVLNLKQAAELAHLSQSTLKRKVSEGEFKNSVHRGRPLRFWRDHFIQEIFKES